ncbi:hypothetical protein KTQ74_28295 [Pseudomonas chlororaphis]|uniref:hypothetical protein n=1 Tax=Pseudomonas chlororaphis TaxID=587753 RepID=UPI001E39995C|nr:hypothetical protein [Pseudomonas chlororaphis]ELF6206753.1 hypothetical protein [Pseudomonas putida]MCB2255825.1 hypothetical protein [Pseudomonas chlororaphis]
MNSTNHFHLADALSAAELVGVGAVRSLDLLRDIDGTIDAITHHCRLFGGAQAAFDAVAKDISSGAATKAIPEGDIIPVLEQLQDSLVKGYAESKEKMQCAIRDPRLRDDDGVVDAYSSLLEAIYALNTTTEKLRWSILESNADKEVDHDPVVLSNPEDINKFLDDL